MTRERVPSEGATWTDGERVVDNDPFDRPPVVEAGAPECAASISGHCLNQTEGDVPCATEDGECIHAWRPASPNPIKPETAGPDMNQPVPYRPNRATRRANSRAARRRKP